MLPLVVAAAAIGAIFVHLVSFLAVLYRYLLVSCIGLCACISRLPTFNLHKASLYRISATETKTRTLTGTKTETETDKDDELNLALAINHWQLNCVSPSSSMLTFNT